jgi:hypothetical protein
MPAGLADQWREGTRYGPPVTGAVVVFGVRGQGVAGDRAGGKRRVAGLSLWEVAPGQFRREAVNGSGRLSVPP